MRTNSLIDDFRETYFVLGDLEELLALAKIDFAPHYASVAGAPAFAPVDVLVSDTVVTRGTGTYHCVQRKGASQ